MAEYSFPVKNQPMSTVEWQSVTLGIGDGILDEGGSPYWITTYDNATNTANLRVSTTRGTANSIIKGHYHLLDEAYTLELPAVVQATTYWVALQYDPVRAADEGRPVELGVFTDLDRSQGKDYVILYRIDRRPNELLTDATVTQYRQRVAPTIAVLHASFLPEPSTVLWGTVAIVHHADEKAVWICKTDGAADPMRWERITGPEPWENLTLGSGRGPASSGYAPAIQREGKKRRLRGRIARTIGDGTIDPSQGHTNLLLFTLAAKDRPAQGFAELTATSGANSVGTARISVGSDGTVATTTDRQVTWVSLDGIDWEVS